MVLTRRRVELIRKRAILLGIAALLSVSALLAVGILLFGHFGPTEARILGTTGLLAAYGLLALPAAILLEQGRQAALAAGLATLSGTGALLALVSVWWSSEPPVGLGKAVGTVTVFAVGATQTAALSARRPRQDATAVRRLFGLSIVLAGIVAVMFAVLIWFEPNGEAYGRLLAALVVLDVLVVALQPILARARPTFPVHHLRIALESGESVVMDIPAADLATAAAQAIRRLEREGRAPVTLGFTPAEVRAARAWPEAARSVESAARGFAGTRATGRERARPPRRPSR
jgi:hypothetical protein